MRFFPRILLYIIITVFTISTTHAAEDLISLFPLNNYDQEVSSWIKPSDADYDKPMMDANTQQAHMDKFHEHYFGTKSPWSREYVNQILSEADDIKTLETGIIREFDNEGKPEKSIGYGANFRPYGKKWIQEIANNINISQFDSLNYQSSNRGIAIDNLHARTLPTEDVYFYSHKMAGEGYPFDNMQMSALWAGTPVYIIAESRDHAWMLVVTPEYIAWVKSKGIARVSDAFVDTWTNAAKNNLAAITQTKTSMVDEKGNFLFSAYVGSVFPGSSLSAGMQLMVPVAVGDRQAVIKRVIVPSSNAALMPVAPTPHQFSLVMKSMIARPYGWGSMYFYNDCSAELKSLLTPFGIWLPRHSSAQVTAGKMVDMTGETPEKRLAYLKENGQRFMTIVYIGGHVVMYVGNYPNPRKQDSVMAMTYQNVWGLSPNPPSRRTVIGKSVLFPMLLQYPEDGTLTSLAAKKYFQVAFLNQLPDASVSLTSGSHVDVGSLMFPEILMFH